MSFQKTVNQYLVPAYPGDFADHGIRAVQVAGEQQHVAGTGGVTVGAFAWIKTDGTVVNAGTGVPAGFIHRNQQGLITTYLAGSTMTINAGFPIAVMAQGAFWAKTTTIATVGQKVFASLTNGTIATGAAGATVAGFIETPFTVASAAAANELIQISSFNYATAIA